MVLLMHPLSCLLLLLNRATSWRRFVWLRGQQESLSSTYSTTSWWAQTPSCSLTCNWTSLWGTPPMPTSTWTSTGMYVKGKGRGGEGRGGEEARKGRDIWCFIQTRIIHTKPHQCYICATTAVLYLCNHISVIFVQPHQCYICATTAVLYLCNHSLKSYFLVLS